MARIYTRTGDAGETSLFAGGRISKGHVRLHAYGTVDELNAILGLVLAAEIETSLAEVLQRVQGELFIVGADLATPLDADAKWVMRTSSAMIEQLETEMDRWQTELPALTQFILPGGGLAGAFLHQARTVCRRAERWLVMLQASEAVNPDALRYLNRLSDWLFVIARVVNHRSRNAERVWVSDRGR